jgi:cysteine desulfurase family protein
MIYLDNASTTFPKAPGLSDFLKNFVETSCFNINRGLYTGAVNPSEMVFETREMLVDFFGGGKSRNVVLTSGVTQSLNFVIKGILQPGDHVITTTMEHNAVYRPLTYLAQHGVNVHYAHCLESGEVCVDDIERLIKLHNPKMVVMTHASNVCGAIMPIQQIGKLCKRYDVLFVLDSAQSAGVIDIKMDRDNIDAVCFTGHKGLLGLPGIGGIVFNNKTAMMTQPINHGGTGSFSHIADMPDVMPDRFEAGTMNLPGIASLYHSLQYINKIGIENIFAKEKELQKRFENGIKKFDNVKQVANKAKNRCAVTAVDFTMVDHGEAAYRLDDEFGIMVRSGLHCAPLAHKTLGTYPQGVVRFSFGYTNTEEEIDQALEAIKTIR